MHARVCAQNVLKSNPCQTFALPLQSQGASMHSSCKSTESQFDPSTAISWASKGLASNLLRALAVLNEPFGALIHF
eukprot:1158638-Pelagomonas_calceolata.AAC.7